MPKLTRWFLKSSLVSFVLAVLLGVLTASGSVFKIDFPMNALLPSYFHLLMVGWVTQLIFGVVYWMFPKFTRDNPHRSEKLGWAVFWLLNIGLLLRVAGEPAMALQPGRTWGWTLAASAVLQWLAGVGFVVNTWSRVKER